MRAFDPDFVTAISATQARFIKLFKLPFCNYTDDEINRYYGGEWYYAAKVSISDIIATATMAVDRMTITMGTPDQTVIAYLLNTDYRGEETIVYQASLDSNGVIDHVERIFTGELNTWDIGAEEARLTVVSPWIRWKKKTQRICSVTCSRRFKRSNYLRGFWPFFEGSGSYAYDRSGNGNTGTLVNMESGDWIEDPDYGQVLSFDGVDEYINCGSGASVNITGALSISFWAYFDIFIIPSSGIITLGLLKYGILYHTNARLYFYLVSSSYSINAAVSSGNWHHIVCTWDGTSNLNNMKIYVDTVLSAEGTLPLTSTGASGDTLLIGKYANCFKGKIGDMRLFAKELSAAEVYELYHYRDKVGGLVEGHCIYEGDLSSCDLSYNSCGAKLQTDNFSGFRHIPSFQDKDIWWGRDRSLPR